MKSRDEFIAEFEDAMRGISVEAFEKDVMTSGDWGAKGRAMKHMMIKARTLLDRMYAFLAEPQKVPDKAPETNGKAPVKR